MSPGLESRGAPKHFLHVHWLGWLGWLHRYTLRRQKKNNRGHLQSQKMIGKMSHHHIVTVSEVTLGMSYLWWLENPALADGDGHLSHCSRSGSTTHPRAMPHWNLFLPSTQSSNFNTQTEMPFLHHHSQAQCFVQNLIHVCYLRFFSANLVAPQTEWPLPSNAWHSPGISQTPDPNPKQPSAPRSRSVRGAQVGLANWRQEALPSGELTYPHFGKRTINENHLQNCYLWKSLYSFFFEPTNMRHSITNPKQHTLFRENTPKMFLWLWGNSPPMNPLEIHPKWSPPNGFLFPPLNAAPSRHTGRHHHQSESAQPICFPNFAKCGIIIPPCMQQIYGTFIYF